MMKTPIKKAPETKSSPILKYKKTETEATMNMRLNEFKSETFSSFEMKLPALTSNKPYSKYDQRSDDLIKCTLLKSPEKYPHASQSTKRLSSMTLKGNTIHYIEKWWDVILSDFCQYLSKNKSWTEYKYIKVENHNIYEFILPPDKKLHYIQQNKNKNHYKYHSEFILLNMKLFPTQNHQNHMSNSLHT